VRGCTAAEVTRSTTVPALDSVALSEVPPVQGRRAPRPVPSRVTVHEQPVVQWATQAAFCCCLAQPLSLDSKADRGCLLVLRQSA
jgi:hypothetical protein